jgi:hypothetical protein
MGKAKCATKRTRTKITTSILPSGYTPIVILAQRKKPALTLWTRHSICLSMRSTGRAPSRGFESPAQENSNNSGVELQGCQHHAKGF